jgi:disulfide bond formation protein DsbB
MWLFPVLMVAAVAGAILLHAPFILWFAVWMLVIGKITGHRHRFHQQQRHLGQQTEVNRPGRR